MATDGEYVTLALVLKTQGRHGEVAAEVHSGVPERFAEGMKLFALPRAEVSGKAQRKASCLPRISDRKSTRLNSSHQIISYAVFCLKKKKNKSTNTYLD